VISGRSPDGKFVEISSWPGHPWYIAVQFHPEFLSKPLRPHRFSPVSSGRPWSTKRPGATPAGTS